MLSTKSFIILFSIFSIAKLSPALSEAVVSIHEYDFGNVKVGSIQTAVVTISTNTSVELTGINFIIQNSCSGITAFQKSGFLPIISMYRDMNFVDIRCCP